MTLAIHPSILSADFLRLGDELARIEHADAVHVDVMDNHFVPNLTFGTAMVEQIARSTKLPIDAHLMIENADREAPAFVAAGAASVTFHAEASAAPLKLAREIRSAGALAGIALRPATGIEPYLDLLEEFDMILVMTVEPGFGGQSFIPSMLTKIARLRSEAQARGTGLRIQVDGGISRETIAHCAAAGADTFVAGSAVYGADDANAEIDALRRLAETGTNAP